MIKHLQFIKKTGVFLVFGLFLVVEGCTTAPSTAQTGILNATSQQIPLLETMTSQKALYDDAYQNLKTYFPPENPVRGAIMGANLENKEEIAGFFDRLQKSQHYSTIVLLSSVEANEFVNAAKTNSITNSSTGTTSSVSIQSNLPASEVGQLNPQTTNVQPFIAVSDYGYQTPYGTLFPPADMLQKISNVPNIIINSVQTSENIAKTEAWPQSIAPFVAKSFPGTNFLPIFINENATVIDDQNFANWLTNNLPADTLVIVQTTPKTSPDQTLAEFQLKFTENVLENFDSTKFSTLPLSNTVAIDVLQRYLYQRQAQRMQNQFMDPQTGSFISFSMDGPVYQSRSVFLVAFGDLMFDRVVRTLMDSHSMDYPFQKMDQTYLKSNDILVANLEGPIAKKRVQTSKTIAFRFDPDIVPLLKKYFFDALSQANNHALDMGIAGFNDTFDLLAPAGIQAFGDPRQIDDKSVATFNVDGQKIAFLGLEEVVYKIDDAKAIAKIQELTAQGYKVIPFMHWGIEYQHTPNNRQEQLAHEFIDAGAVAVIGCHPHVVETYETYKNHPIFYSLGNAIFDQYFSPDTQEGLSLALILSKDQIEIYFLPIKIDKSQFRLMSTDERKAFLQRFVTYGDYETEAEREDILNGELTIHF